MSESRWHRCEFGIAAVGVPTGVARLRAEVLLSADAELAHPTGVSQPGDSDAITDAELAAGVLAQRDDFADDLVSRYHVGPVYGQIPFGDVQIGAAHTARLYGDEQLTGRGRRHGHGDPLQRMRVHRAGPRTCHALIVVPAVMTP